MRTLRLAIVLLSLAVFVGATMAAAEAAMASPTAIGTPIKKTTTTPTPLKAPTKTPVPKMAGGMGMFSQANNAAGDRVKLEAAKMTQSTMRDIARNSGKTSARLSLPGMGSQPQLDHLRQMPAMGSLKMPDWTAPGIILTI